MEKQIQHFMDGLSAKPDERLARTSSGVAYNQGRNAEMMSAADEGKATHAIRSEILDENTCPECAKWDDLIVEIGSPSYSEYHPPAQCLGRDQCRGFYVVVPEEEE